MKEQDYTDLVGEIAIKFAQSEYRTPGAWDELTLREKRVKVGENKLKAQIAVLQMARAFAAATANSDAGDDPNFLEQLLKHYGLFPNDKNMTWEDFDLLAEDQKKGGRETWHS